MSFVIDSDSDGITDPSLRLVPPIGSLVTATCQRCGATEEVAFDGDPAHAHPPGWGIAAIIRPHEEAALWGLCAGCMHEVVEFLTPTEAA